MFVHLEYRPCKCPQFSPSRPELEGAEDERAEVDSSTPEHFDREGIAARRFRQHKVEGRTPLVHHQGLHVKAVVIGDERFEE